MLKECGLRWRSNLSMGYLQSLEAMQVGVSVKPTITQRQ